MQTDSEPSFTKNVLVAVDKSENSRRVVDYVGAMLGSAGGFHVTLLHVIPLPEEDYFRDDAARREWENAYRSEIEGFMEAYRRALTAAGFADDAVDMLTPRRYCPSMAECILAEWRARSYSTIVVGRQGLSRKEEFLFGSISSKIVNHARDCTVWVVA
mgnify:CR=1 FL=1